LRSRGVAGDFVPAIWAGALVLLLFQVMPALAQETTKGAEAYRVFPLFGSRLAVWGIAQIHLNFAAFILGVPIFAVIVEVMGMRTKDPRYDWLARDPVLLLGFTAAQGLILFGVVLYVVVVIFAQRTMVLEEFGPGEVIFSEGDQGRHVYVIKSGSVEVLAKRPDGSQEVINRLGSGDHFGEMALLRKAPRSGTVRTVTPVEVFKMNPSNFMALYTSMPGLRDHFQKVMQPRLREFEHRK